jgi:predicted kinase
MAAAGTDTTRLVVLRGPSGSGKSSTARALRAHLGRRLALVEQDYLRRIVLKERDVPGGANIELISHTARFALNRGWDVVLEGIMHSERYAAMLNQLRGDHAGSTAFYYFDVSWEEALRRHRTRPQAREFGIEEMREWYRPRDLLGFADERIVPETSELDETVNRILREVFQPSPAIPDMRT